MEATQHQAAEGGFFRPAHGATRGWHLERTETPVEMQLPDGTPVTTYTNHTQSVSWRWCEGCQEWIRVAGVLGALAFTFDHLNPHRPAVVEAVAS